MLQTIRSLTLFGLVTLAAACDTAPTPAADAKTVDNTAAMSVPGPASHATVKPVAGGVTGVVDADESEAHRPDASEPATVAAKAGDGDRAAVARKGPDRVKDGDPGAKPVATKVEPVATKVEPVAAKTEPVDDAGGSLVEKEGWSAYQKELQAKISAVNNSCGSKLSASYDKATYVNFDPMQDRTQAACEAAVGTLQPICATEEGKAAVQKLSRTVCKFSTTGTGIVKSGTTLVVKIDPAKSSITGKQAGGYSWLSAIKENL